MKEQTTSVDIAGGTKIVSLPKPRRAWRSRYVPHTGGGGLALYKEHRETMRKQREEYIRQLNSKSATAEAPAANDIKD